MLIVLRAPLKNSRYSISWNRNTFCAIRLNEHSPTVFKVADLTDILRDRNYFI